MRNLAVVTLFIGLLAGLVRADDFVQSVDIEPMRAMSLQHNQTVKTFDTYARDTILTVTGKSKVGGHAAAATVLDMAFSPEGYVDQNLIYIRNKPFRNDFKHLPFVSPAEQDRILKEGTISLGFWMQPQTQEAMGRLMATATIKAKAINEINDQASLLGQLLDYPHYRHTLITTAFVPSEDASHANEKPWETVPGAMMHLLEHSEGHNPAYVEGVMKMAANMEKLRQAWIGQDAATVKTTAAELATIAQGINPKAYPSQTKRNFEVRYNSLSRLTWPGAAIYFIAAVFFIVFFTTDLKWTYVTGWVLVLIGLAVHTAAIGIRWWLVEKSVGNWFESIPIKNQFESVMFSAWFGTVVAVVLETGIINRLFKRILGFEFRKLHGMGIFGCAGAAVGMLSLLALFATPYITKSDIIGGGIRQNAGILMTYWLYIHVTLVTASYALIGMTFILGTWYCIQYLVNRESKILQTLDAANLTMLQLAFWILMIGIITGALWADVSWGRPWGWDPKETFALITWIVYLIIIHIRFVTSGTNRAILTSVLSVVGFFVMLFNWIGVNFFLVGLHSYA